MRNGCVVVLDVGKSNSKLALWTRDGRRLAVKTRANADLVAPGYRALDVEGVQTWLRAELRALARQAEIAAIVPIAHGAAAALIAEGRLAAPPMSYETPLPPNAAYDAARDPFARTGSPRLPNGLNLGAQLDRLDALFPERDTQIVTYAQYWAWALCGVAASELSSLGCHTDLWLPYEGRFSRLAVERGWSRRFAPVRHADELLGAVSPAWAAETGVSRDCVVYCGAHDSNVAFHGARHHPQLSGRDLTIISTGTWFVAMRAPCEDTPPDLDARRDTLLNISVDGRPIPSARFMGGREMELIIGAEDSPMRAPEFARDVAPLHLHEVLRSGAMITPSFAPGVGPFPARVGRWEGAELRGPARRAAAGMYLALVADVSLSLIGARDAIVVEGRFADDLSFLRMLATLRPSCDIYAARSDDGLAFGALRLVDPDLAPAAVLTKIEPLDVDVSAYAHRWRALAETSV